MLASEFWNRIKIVAPTECWIWRGKYSTKPGSYGKVVVDGRIKRAHRMAWELTNGHIPNGLYVLHKCDNPPCCNPSHLFLGTDGDNLRDCYNKGRRKPLAGKLNPMATLTESDVIEIRKRYSEGAKSIVLASDFGVSVNCIYRIFRGFSWRKIGGPIQGITKKRLTKEEIKQVIQMKSEGIKQTEIASKFKTSRSVISKIVNR